MMEDVLVKLKPRLPWQKLHLTNNGDLFTSTLDLKLGRN